MNRFLQPVAGLALATTACNRNSDDATVPSTNVSFVLVATSQVLWTGVAVTSDNRLFANFPRMDTDTIPYSVAEVGGAQATPFPNADCNTWVPGLPPADHFICVQSVYVDANNFPWVVDAANLQMRGVAPGGPKLLKFGPNTRQLLQRIVFDEIAAPLSSHSTTCAWIRTKTWRTSPSRAGVPCPHCYLATGKARRLLANSPTRWKVVFSGRRTAACT